MDALRLARLARSGQRIKDGCCELGRDRTPKTIARTAGQRTYKVAGYLLAAVSTTQGEFSPFWPKSR